MGLLVEKKDVTFFVDKHNLVQLFFPVFLWEFKKRNFFDTHIWRSQHVFIILDPLLNYKEASQGTVAYIKSLGTL